MLIEFDPDKDATNLQKYGVSLAEAEHMDFASAVIVQDRRYDYGETRYQALGLLDGRLHLLVFTMRVAVLRAISLRKANAREERHYDRKA